MVEADFERIVEAIDLVLQSPQDEAAIEKAKKIALELCEANPLPY